jgi:hypothetical protein
VRWQEIVGAAILIPIISLIAVWAVRTFGKWMLTSMQRSFGLVVVEVMAPDMAHLATKVTASIDELNTRNTADHLVVRGRLDGVEHQLAVIEIRLVTVENRLGIRPPDARTRATDRDDG